MTSSEVVTSLSMEEDNIDRDRIVDGHLVPDEYFCPICQYLLWKPRSCASCQHIFCEKCIRTWLENPNSGNKCPFRCEPFEDRRCPPYVQSLLARLNIRCRNSLFGCSQILPYDVLERHENVECKYLTRRCSECEKLVLIAKFDEHREFPGLCVPHSIKCTICQNYIEKKINELTARASLNQTLQTPANAQAVPPNHGLTFIHSIVNTIQLFEQQKQMSRLPTNLKGVDAVRRAREQGCGHLYYILIILKFILSNWRKAPFFIFIFAIGGFVAVGVLILGGYVIFSYWAYTHVYRGPFLIILLSYLLSYGTSIVFQFFSDTTIIFCFGFFIFLCGCSSRASLEVLEMDAFFNKPILNIVRCCAGIFIMKIILLLTRLYYWSMPTYMAAGLFTFVNFYLAFKTHRVHANTIATTTNQPMMTV